MVFLKFPFFFGTGTNIKVTRANKIIHNEVKKAKVWFKFRMRLLVPKNWEGGKGDELVVPKFRDNWVNL